ncbi:kin of IRRE 1 [Octopus vulgaris]|uniref:Kin of IRRE 1 n=1 Tax=Octopus vulgaris TaxID=6645 RepID=A0AA36AVL1_OCTVU|nr:kin of IRRE 1 [Octopus vulgaris]
MAKSELALRPHGVLHRQRTSSKPAMMLQQGIILLLFTVISYSSENEIMPHEKTIKAFLSKPVTLQCHFPGVKEHDNIQIKCNRPGSSSHLIFLIKVIKNEIVPHVTTIKAFYPNQSLFNAIFLELRQKVTFLTFPSITKEHDNIQIKCNRPESSSHLIFLIKVINFPTVQVNSVNVKIGEQATLKCNVEDSTNFQIASLKWTQKIFGHQIEGHVSNETQLIFNNTSWRDTGNWTCTIMVTANQKTQIIKGSGILSASANNVLTIGITCAVIVLILVTLIICCFWYFSIRKIPSVTEKREYSSDSTKLSSVKYIRDFNKDEFISENDEPIYAEIGYIDMDRAKALKATQNEYLSPKSVNSLKRIQNEGTIDRKSTENVYLNPLSVNSLKHAQNEALIG